MGRTVSLDLLRDLLKSERHGQLPCLLRVSVDGERGEVRGQGHSHAPLLGAREDGAGELDGAGGVDALGERRGSGELALRNEEGQGHGATDHEGVDALYKVEEDGELRVDLDAAQDGGGGGGGGGLGALGRGRGQGRVEGDDLAGHQEAGGAGASEGGGDTHHGRVLAVGLKGERGGRAGEHE